MTPRCWIRSAAKSVVVCSRRKEPASRVPPGGNRPECLPAAAALGGLLADLRGAQTPCARGGAGPYAATSASGRMLSRFRQAFSKFYGALLVSTRFVFTECLAVGGASWPGAQRCPAVPVGAGPAHWEALLKVTHDIDLPPPHFSVFHKRRRVMV